MTLSQTLEQNGIQMRFRTSLNKINWSCSCVNKFYGEIDLQLIFYSKTINIFNETINTL